MSKKPTPDLLSRAAERFQLVGLGHWATAAEGWCQRFAGLEHRAGEDEIAPACCLLRVALRYSRERARPSDVKVAEDLAVLPFTRWHARWPAWATPSKRSEGWRPLEQPFSTFARRYSEADNLVVWESALPVVAPQDAIQYLLSRIAAVQSPPAGEDIP